MENYEEIMNERKKKIFGKGIMIFFGTMMVITFFSKTIQNMLLPEVTVSRPSSGILTYEAAGTGTIIPKETVHVYPQSTKRIKEIRIEAGEKVKKGQILALLYSQASDSKLTEEEINLRKLETNLEKLLLETKSTQVGILEVEMEKASERVAKLKDDLNKKHKLLEAGAETAENVREAQYNLETAQKDYQQKKIELQEEKNKQQVSQEEKRKDIEALRYDIQSQQLKIEELQGEEAVISPCDGIVKEIYAQSGKLAPDHEPICSVVHSEKGFSLSVSLDLENNSFVSAGDSMLVSLKSTGKLVDIPIRKIVIKDNYKELTADLDETDFLGGERVDYRIIKKSKNFNMMIPNTALGRDNGGYFIFLLKEREGALGKEYYAEKQYVTIGDSDNRNTVIVGGLENRSNIVYDSEKVIRDGSRVRLKQRM
ncbi:HlyD family secretion protein [Geosporobacter ferrireducens]|uniref:Membrane fusion protein biotin-lipoyl like domain-containing protein n=2 Tax=Geosporobacter ferrireducens TaxID=1424294 RepID=A0A1D8GL90_9FIRM|nr:efflux RND transporter periplasmic adaptor subunit [Geosporobacter ferrireducens]AOT71670.1 hypothetical protein Gferi_20300 [Geosporobacter ferrireducens]MTI55441.1 efflux RND transporter periplasmic adaptor subunit [Geosporobacter ferrireducens]